MEKSDKVIPAYNTGLYHYPSQKVVDYRYDPKKFRTHAESVGREPNLNTLLAEAQKFAQEIIDHCRDRSDDEKWEQYQRLCKRNKKQAEKFLSEQRLGFGLLRVKSEGAPHNVKERYEEAQTLRAYIQDLHQALDKGDSRKAALYGFLVGKYYEALRVRRGEPRALDGRKHQQRMKEMRRKAWAVKTGNSPEDQSTIKQRVLQDIAAHSNENPTAQPKVIYPTVAKKYGISVRTLYRYLNEDIKKRSVIS